MIGDVDAELVDWAAAVVGTAADVSLAAPGNPSKPVVNLHLAAMLPAPPLRGERRPPIQLALRYMVSAWAADVTEQHRLLSDLAVAAMIDPRYEVELEPADPEWWQAFAATPRPCFYLKVPVRREQPEPKTKLVRKPIVIEGTNLSPLSGTVVGPGDVPLAAAMVEIPSADLATQTDYAGRFGFSGVPMDPPKKVLRVKARRHEMSVEVSTASREPLVIRFEELED